MDWGTVVFGIASIIGWVVKNHLDSEKLIKDRAAEKRHQVYEVILKPFFFAAIKS